MSTMFMPIKFNTTVILTPNEFNKNFDNTILLKIKSTLDCDVKILSKLFLNQQEGVLETFET